MRAGRLALAALVLFGGAAAAATGDALIVTGDVVNVRLGPTTQADVKMQLYRDQQVLELERQGGWVRVEIAGTGEEGWVHQSLLGPSVTAPTEAEPSDPPVAAAPAEPAPATEPEAALAMPEPAEPSPEPAVGPLVDPAGLERFRASVDYLNTRAQQVAGVDLFTGVEAASETVVQVTATEAWSTIPPAGQRSYLNTLVDRWAAARGGGEASVQILDPSGEVVMERSGP